MGAVEEQSRKNMIALLQEAGGGVLWLIATAACTCLVVGVFILVDCFFKD